MCYVDDTAGSVFMDLVRSRTSCRAYKNDPVPRGQIESMLEAARLAPSACNKQPWRFVVIMDGNTRKRVVEDGLLPGLSMEWVIGAPVIIVLGMEKSFLTHKVAPKLSGVEYPLIDLGIAGEHLVLRATELGLGTCWIGWIKPAVIRKIVGWPRSIDPVGIITVGLPAEQNENRPRQALDDISKWI